jgi:hypothetical protein
MSVIDRDTLHDNLLIALLRGEAHPSNVRYWLDELAALKATTGECAGREDAYSRLLIEGPPPVAAYAQSVLADLHRAGLLPTGEVVSISREVLTRPEKKLRRAQLDWLDRTLRAEPGCAPEAVRMLTEAAESVRDATLRERAEKLIDRHRTAASPVPAAPEPFGVPTTPTETAELYRWITRQQRDDHRVAEQFLDGVIRFAHQDRAGLTAALSILVDRDIRAVGGSKTRWRRTAWWKGQGWSAVTVAAIATGALQHPPGMRHFDSDVLKERMREWGAVALKGVALPPFSLATPTFDNDRIAADDLVERLRRYEELGVRPGLIDFTQALVRVGRTSEPEVLAKADALRTLEGARLAAWLRNRAAGADIDAFPEPFRATLRQP